MCRLAILNPRIRVPILSLTVLTCADRCQNALIIFGITLGDNDGDLRFPLDTVFLVVPLLVIGLKLSIASFAVVLAALAAPTADLKERCGRG